MANSLIYSRLEGDSQATPVRTSKPQYGVVGPHPTMLRTIPHTCSVSSRKSLFAVVLICAVFLLGYYFGQRPTQPSLLPSIPGSIPGSMSAADIPKPNGVRIVGLIFFGRRQFVDILDCYLRRNLAVNGGFLDEIHFLLHARHEEDEEWLKDMVKKTPELEGQYKLLNYSNVDYSHLWKHCDELNTIYVKIDDDVVYVHDDAIPRIVTSLIRHKEAHSIQANIVNSARTMWLHLHTDAIHPYVPDKRKPPQASARVSWRASQLPFYTKKKTEGSELANLPQGHRWLPFKNANSEAMEKTPIMNASAPDSKGLINADWKIGAQEHYSFLHNLEFNTLNKYWAGNAEGIFNMWYAHYTINFMAIWGHHVRAHKFWEWPWGGDEYALSEALPRMVHMPVKIDTHAIVSHFSFEGQTEGLMKTDLLDRYRAYANEMVCEPNNQKTPFDGAKPGTRAEALVQAG